ncbi:RpiR family transcriptional regulator [Salipaludibacillus neizhouensis]|uniref:RpiR family transcriptional regulator n=1 Tax=Salipaludibacillus neizhouensis TaxID=885475 RepID=A0A3A9K1X6_9BACI|nr:MurR/RpiR family transcriptional regulator [Salipaludibacillus neizhouensis]RKL67124.1 RpiR family transcriptional regulator [Salipaludibacillus neizhouensis]
MAAAENRHCKHRIRASYHSFREKEQRIADYILAHPEEIIHSTISQVAEKLQVAEATVFRFCKHIGFKGYQAMKIALASEIVTGMKDIHETIQEGDDEQLVAEKVFKANIRTLEETLTIIDGNNFKRAVDMILNANRLEFYGNGGSGAIALDAHHKFMRTGIPCISYSDSHFQVMSASQLTEKDVVVLISHTGTNRDILDALEIAKEQGAMTIGITTLAKSPLSQGVDVALYTVSEETDYRSEALSSRLAQLTLIDALYVNVSMQRKELMKKSLTKVRKAISAKRI